MTEPLECIDGYDGECYGEVAYRSVDGRGSAPPRCDKHFGDRLDRRENSVEKYEHSDVVPSWFDPADAGERWDY